ARGRIRGEHRRHRVRGLDEHHPAAASSDRARPDAARPAGGLRGVDRPRGAREPGRVRRVAVGASRGDPGGGLRRRLHRDRPDRRRERGARASPVARRRSRAGRDRGDRRAVGPPAQREPDACAIRPGHRRDDPVRHPRRDPVDAGARPEPEPELRRRSRPDRPAGARDAPRGVAGALRDRPDRAPGKGRHQSRIRGAGGPVARRGRVRLTPVTRFREDDMTLRRHTPLALGLALLAALTLPLSAGARLAVSGNDNKVLNVNGVVTVVPTPPPDTVSLIDLKQSPPKATGGVQAPVSGVGPPPRMRGGSAERLGLGTASNKVDPSDKTKQTPDNRVTVIDLKATPPKVIATLEAGMGAAGISVNRQGTLALVSNLVDGTVSVFTIQGKTVTPAGTVEVGGKTAGGGMVAITPDGKTALVSRSNDNKISVLSIDGAKVEYTHRDMTAGVRPIVLDAASNGAFAVVASLAGGGAGGSDRISVSDLDDEAAR